MNGLISILSSSSAAETIRRITERLATANITLFATIDHAAGATQAGLALRPTCLLIFGDPKAGTALMQDRQTAGIDLPLKLLVWEDEQAKVWITYNNLEWIKTRHRLSDAVDARVHALGAGLQKLIDGI